MSRRALLPVIPAVLAAVLLAGCGENPPPQVTFTTDGQQSTVGPLRYCDIDLTECREDNAMAELDVRAGQTVRVTVPEEVAAAPWQVVFRYRTETEPVEGRSEVFAPGSQREFSLRVPEGAALETIEVQEYGAPTTVANEQTFRIRASWVLGVVDRG